MYESDRTVPLTEDDYALIHFMTVEEESNGDAAFIHYAVRIFNDNTLQVFINGLDQGPGRQNHILSLTGAAGFGPSPSNPVPHVLAEFKIGLTAAGFGVSATGAYSPDPAWWSSVIPPPPPTNDQDGDGVPDDQDNCPSTPNANQGMHPVKYILPKSPGDPKLGGSYPGSYFLPFFQ